MNWTKEFPSRSGFYWMKKVDGEKETAPRIVFIVCPGPHGSNHVELNFHWHFYESPDTAKFRDEGFPSRYDRTLYCGPLRSPDDPPEQGKLF